jgi:hypothetical protein
VKPVVLEGVDGVFHAVLIEPEGNRAHKRRRRQAAGPAKSLGRRTFGSAEGIAAASAHGAALDGEFCPANIANWHRGKLRQRGAAEATGSRQEGATQGVHGTSEHAGHGAPPRSLRWWNVERQ